MPTTTAMRRVSTLVVGALFAVIFVCSGVSAAQPTSSHTDAVVSANTTPSKAAVRATTHTVKAAQASPHLASTGPTDDASPEATDAPAAQAAALVVTAPATFSASERAPPTH